MANYWIVVLDCMFFVDKYIVKSHAIQKDKEKPQKGEVIALGTGKVASDGKKIAFNVKVGDTVLFKKYSPDEIELDGDDYLIMDEEAILGVIN